MKAEERHELRENDLANWLQFGLWAFLKQNGSYILLVLALAFLGYRLWAFHEQKLENARYAAYAELNNANSIDALDNLVTTSDIKPIKAQAALKLGQYYSLVAVSPDESDKQQLSRPAALSKSYEYYTKALEFQGEDAVIAGKAHVGIAGIYEDQGEWDKAKTEYQHMIDDKLFAGSALADLAKDRLASLDDRRNAPRLAAMIPPPKPATPLPGLQNPGLAPLPGGLMNPGTGGGLLGPSTSPFQGPLFGPPAPSSTAPATANPSSGLSPFRAPPMGGISPLTPATAPTSQP